MEPKEIGSYLIQVEAAITKANEEYKKDCDLDKFFQTSVSEIEKVVARLDAKIRTEGVSYSTVNEPRATARALLWVGWVSWLWTAKAERTQDSDTQAKKMRPIVERLLEQSISTGRLIGKNGSRPENFQQ